MFLTMFVLVGCNNETSSETDEDEGLEEKGLELEQQNQAFQVTITELEQENENLQEQIDAETVPDPDLDEIYASHDEQVQEILSYFSEEQLSLFAEDQWQYRLSVNDVAISESGVIEVEADEIEISLSQRQPDMSLLPDDLFEQGQISGESYHEHILEVTPDPTEERWRDGTIVTGYGLIYTDLTSGTEIQLMITDELQARLGFETNQLMIRIK